MSRASAREPSGRIVRERTKLLVVVVFDAPAHRGKVREIVEAYNRRFGQHSVFRIRAAGLRRPLNEGAHGAVHLCPLPRPRRTGDRGRRGIARGGRSVAPGAWLPGDRRLSFDREPRLFYIHSRWVDEAAFETHAGLPHTVRFVERMQPLIDHPFEATRATPIG